MAWISDVKRRDFLATAAGVAAVGAQSSLAGPRRGIWIDPKLASLPARPWRKAHLDFHNTPWIKSIGEKFNADEFGDRLVAGNVSGIVVFAKDMHGYFYCPSKFMPVHPGLKFHLLGQKVEACSDACVSDQPNVPVQLPTDWAQVQGFHEEGFAPGG